MAIACLHLCTLTALANDCPLSLPFQSELAAAKRQIDGLQRPAGYGGRPGDAEMDAAAAEGAGRAEEGAEEGAEDAFLRLEVEPGSPRHVASRQPEVCFAALSSTG